MVAEPIILKKGTFLMVQTSGRERISKKIPPPPVVIEASPTENIIEGLIAPSPARSSMSQGDFLCTITKEGDILEAEAIEVAILEAFAPITSEAESWPAASSNAGLELIVVATLKASPSVPPVEGVSAELVIISSSCDQNHVVPSNSSNLTPEGADGERPRVDGSTEDQDSGGP
ncbi:hypothetical protein AMTR_s00054p00170120 [Amborella trichopoda]|uniref:Uncharacterized protein n=1 Tax=Amborella trichopoda TaxID=13333 RepID=U5D6U6_AMBTC|nr:hypothetical protein AMTR_s00054p00170120 [Amborella trichopoda]